VFVLEQELKELKLWMRWNKS